MPYFLNRAIREFRMLFGIPIILAGVSSSKQRAKYNTT